MIQKSPYIEVLQYNKKKFVDFIANMIIHEVTHSLDPQVSSKLSKFAYDQEKYNKEYWNTRMETKAYLQQIHSEIFDELHHLKIKATYNNMAAISLENFVKRLKKKPEIILLLSETWKKIKHLIDDKKVKRKYYLMAWHIAPKVLEELSET